MFPVASSVAAVAVDGQQQQFDDTSHSVKVSPDACCVK
jgi:hypothetical protein